MLHQWSKKTRFLRYALIIAAFLVLSLAHHADAASLSLSPASPKVSIGNIVSLKIIVATDGKVINSADSILQFPLDLLEVVSVSKSSSIFSMWVEEPKFSNFDGKVTFSGGLPNPGYNGQNGEILTVTFKAKKAGTASVVFSDSSVRQNDGLGTDILTNKLPTNLAIVASEQVPQTPAVIAAGTPAAPKVISSSHPDENKWYSNNIVDLSWGVPNDVTAVSTSISRDSAMPSIIYNSPITSRKFSNLEDGVWYFNIRFKNGNGWGAVTHFKIQIDTMAPNSFKITFPHGSVSEDPRPIVLFNTTDITSGVEHYEIKIGESEFNRIALADVKSNPYATEPQDPGDHHILVKAVDFANNETIQSSDFTITAINTPIITEYPTELDKGDLLRIRGTSYPLSTVEVVVEDSAGHRVSQLGNVQIDGSFTMIWAKSLPLGSYTISARAIDKKEAKSNFSKPVNFTVKESTLTNTSSLILNWLSVIIILILLIGGTVLLITYFINKNLKIKKSIRKEIKATESSVHKAFDLLRENIRQQIKMLQKAKTTRELTKEEEKIIKNLNENLAKSEKYLEEELSSIEEELS